MTRKYFGTDGVRGTVGQAPMTPDFVLRLGFAAGKVLAGQSKNASVLIGKDTRISGYMVEAALEAGFSAAGVDVLLCGPLPTPGVAYLTRALRRLTSMARLPGAVAPNMSLMLKPSGATPIEVTSAPSSWNTCGATS